MSGEYMEIAISRYLELVDKERWLDALEASGVDNWDGYDFAREYYEGVDEEDL